MGQSRIRQTSHHQHPTTLRWRASITVGDDVVQSGWTHRADDSPWALANELARRLEVAEAQLATQTTIARALLLPDAEPC